MDERAIGDGDEAPCVAVALVTEPYIDLCFALNAGPAEPIHQLKTGRYLSEAELLAYLCFCVYILFCLLLVRLFFTLIFVVNECAKRESSRLSDLGWKLF